MKSLTVPIILLSPSSMFIEARIFNRDSGFFYLLSSDTPIHLNLDCSICIAPIWLLLRTSCQKILSKVSNLNSWKYSILMITLKKVASIKSHMLCFLSYIMNSLIFTCPRPSDKSQSASGFQSDLSSCFSLHFLLSNLVYPRGMVSLTSLKLLNLMYLLLIFFLLNSHSTYPCIYPPFALCDLQHLKLSMSKAKFVILILPT